MTTSRTRRRIDDPGWNLHNALERLDHHDYDCKKCLRHRAGFRSQPCFVHETIVGQIEKLQRAVNQHYNAS